MAMEDQFQFIIESPQHSTGQKKRPRLVTSCDNCRLKKIKCLQPNPDAKCDACKTAKIPCRFKDREKYFAERSRAIQSPNEQRYASRSNTPTDTPVTSASSSPISSHQEISRHSSRSPKTTSGLVAPDMEYARYQPYAAAADSRRSRQAAASPVSSFHSTHTRSNSQPSSLSYNYSPPPSSQPVIQVQLFDPDQPIQPHPHLLHQFIPLFFDHYARDYPFLMHQDIIRAFMDRRLSPLLSNCLAAMACRHHSNPDIATAAVEMTYSTQAKQIFAQPHQKQSLHSLQALIILGWYDYYRNQFDGFRQCTQVAVQLGLEMRLPEYKYVSMAENERSNNVLPLTWMHILNMQQTLASTSTRSPAPAPPMGSQRLF